MTVPSTQKGKNSSLIVALIAASAAIIAAIIPNWNSIFHSTPHAKPSVEEFVCSNIETLLPYIKEDFLSIKQEVYYKDSTTIWYKSKIKFGQMKSSVCQAVIDSSYYFNVLIYEGDSAECLKQYKSYNDYIGSCYGTSTLRNIKEEHNLLRDFYGEYYDIRLQMFSKISNTYELHLYLQNP